MTTKPAREGLSGVGTIGGMDDEGQPYEPAEIEPRWQARLARRRAPTRSTTTTPARSPTSCACTRTPAGRPTWATCATTPSATCIVRYRTMNGHAVLSPIGFDSFGLPAENAAIKTGEHPRPFTEAQDRGADARPCCASGASTTGAGRSRATTRPTSAGPSGSSCASWKPAWPTAAEAPVNWCPGCQTVLANEQVLADGTCERSGDLVERKEPGAVVLQDHRLRPAAARRHRRPRLARAGEDHAAQLDRSLRRRRVRPGRRRPMATAPTAPRCGLHHPPRHQLRHDLRGRRPRAPTSWPS